MRLQPASRPATQLTRWHARGLTLVEVVTVLAVVGIVATMAVPSQLASLQRARRLDATAALTRLQMAQERHRGVHGLYAVDLASLGGPSRSGEGLYDLQLRNTGDGSVVLAARARNDGAQGGDTECAEITLRLDQGLADAGPSGRCWSQ